MIRAVLDVNVLVSAVITRDGTPARLLTAWDEGRFELVVSRQLITELTATLAKTNVRKRVPPPLAAGFIAELKTGAHMASDGETETSIRSADPDDDYLIALAMKHRAALVSGDRHLTDLQGTIPVFSPAEFLDYLAAA